ncbi:MAG TPA: N-acetyl-alpha-D-glucosaminyl L-malate synthase BshA [Phycisphaerae bacterium]|nr:N-acetyl-alpha-D-glucosaminyl L-malate synthase BshA [Phycisphaerae bacterium]
MSSIDQFNIGITCYPSVGGSGILASALGEELANRGHEVHFISYERPFRLPANSPRIHFHSVEIGDFSLFPYPDYTLPLSVKMAEVSRDCALDVLHVHYAVPHATAAVLARSMLPENQRPRLVTTLHGTDTTLLAGHPGYGPAIRHALDCSDAVTAVSHFLKSETERQLEVRTPIEVIHNFFTPRPLRRSRAEVRRELEVREDEVLILHTSNLRPLKRIDLLLESVALLNPRDSFKLLILAGESFAAHEPLVKQLGLSDRVLVRDRIIEIEEYFQAADLGLITSETESFCLSILEGMSLGCPSVATRVGGIPEVVDDGETGLLVEFGNACEIACAVQTLIVDSERRKRMGNAAQRVAGSRFSAESIVPRYESLYRRVMG